MKYLGLALYKLNKLNSFNIIKFQIVELNN